MLKTALNMIEELSNPYLINNLLKTVAENKNTPKSHNFYQMSKFKAEKSKLRQAPL